MRCRSVTWRSRRTPCPRIRPPGGKEVGSACRAKLRHCQPTCSQWTRPPSRGKGSVDPFRRFPRNFFESFGAVYVTLPAQVRNLPGRSGKFYHLRGRSGRPHTPARPAGQVPPPAGPAIPAVWQEWQECRATGQKLQSRLSGPRLRHHYAPPAAPAPPPPRHPHSTSFHPARQAHIFYFPTL